MGKEREKTKFTSYLRDIYVRFITREKVPLSLSLSLSLSLFLSLSP